MHHNYCMQKKYMRFYRYHRLFVYMLLSFCIVTESINLPLLLKFTDFFKCLVFI